MTWPYADKEWWFSEIHSAVRPTLLRDASGENTSEPSRCPTADEVSYFYSRVLRILAAGRISHEGAQSLLFYAKALKKWKLSDARTAHQRQAKAIAGFVQRDERAACQELPSSDTLYLMKRVLERWLPRVTPSEFLGEQIGDERKLITGRFGPGACAEHYTHVQRFDKLRTWCELSRTGSREQSDLGHWPEVPLSCGDGDHVVARLCAVPKEETKDRLITVEPAYSTFSEQYVRSAILESIHRGPLRGSAMDQGYVDGAQVQRGLALRASKNGRLATLDLKDASDNITWDLVQRVFPSWLVELLEVTRSTSYCYRHPDTHHQITRTLNMFGGMGNACTFSIETLFFSAYAVACAQQNGLSPFVSTFGDDIIVTSDVACALMKKHDACFVINHDKSFWGGDALRESCGIFAYKGVDITVPKVDGYPNTWEGRTALCDLHRRLYGMSAGFAQRLSYSIGSPLLLVNWPFEVLGYPSISDDRLPYSALPPTRYNRYSQTREAKVMCRQLVLRRFSTDWTVCQRHNLPPPQTWLYASLCGMVGTVDEAVRVAERKFGGVEPQDAQCALVARSGSQDIVIPVKGAYRMRTCWSTIRIA